MVMSNKPYKCDMIHIFLYLYMVGGLQKFGRFFLF